MFLRSSSRSFWSISWLTPSASEACSTSFFQNGSGSFASSLVLPVFSCPVLAFVFFGPPCVCVEAMRLRPQVQRRERLSEPFGDGEDPGRRAEPPSGIGDGHLRHTRSVVDLQRDRGVRGLAGNRVLDLDGEALPVVAGGDDVQLYRLARLCAPVAPEEPEEELCLFRGPDGLLSGGEIVLAFRRTGDLGPHLLHLRLRLRTGDAVDLQAVLLLEGLHGRLALRIVDRVRLTVVLVDDAEDVEGLQALLD